MAMENFYTGYRQREGEKRQEQMQGIQALGQVQGVMENMRAQQEREQVKQAITSAPTPEAALSVLQRMGTPTAMKAAQAILEAKSKQAVTSKNEAQTREIEEQRTHVGALSQYLMGPQSFRKQEGMPDVTQTALSDEEAMRRVQEADARGEQATVGVVPPQNVATAMAVRAAPKQAIPALVRQQGAARESPLARLTRERDALPPDDPRRQNYDRMIEKLTTHQPPVNVYSGGLVPGQTREGEPVFVQPSAREGVPPRIVEGVQPRETAADRKERIQARQAEATLEAVTDRVTKLVTIIRQNPSSVGLVGEARRAAEVVGGISEGMGGPALGGTPAIDLRQQQSLLLADVRKILERDPTLSNEERRRLYDTIGSGMTQTPSSSIRALNEVLETVKSSVARMYPNAGNETRVPRPTTQQDFDRLPSGTVYIDPEDGKRYRKP